MKKSILLQTIKTPNGDTNAYSVISFLLEVSRTIIPEGKPPPNLPFASPSILMETEERNPVNFGFLTMFS